MKLAFYRLSVRRHGGTAFSACTVLVIVLMISVAILVDEVQQHRSPRLAPSCRHLSATMGSSFTPRHPRLGCPISPDSPASILLLTLHSPPTTTSNGQRLYISVAHMYILYTTAKAERTGPKSPITRNPTSTAVGERSADGHALLGVPRYLQGNPGAVRRRVMSIRAFSVTHAPLRNVWENA
ncbi:hypothetical protein C8R43DRAFT_1136162 [Mycena crocata]|nr:hypothetical protein C8R43DRAFT_1136162 [Mycena crocata]